MLSRAPIVSESQGVPNEPGFVTQKCHGVSDSVCVKGFKRVSAPRLLGGKALLRSVTFHVVAAQAVGGDP